MERLKNYYWKIKQVLSRNNVARMLVTLVLILLLPFEVKLAQQIIRLISEAQTPTVEVSFVPASQSLPPASNTKIMIDAKSNNLAFVRLSFTFDLGKVGLLQEITLSDQFKNVITKTSMAQANSTGKVVLVAGVSPGDPLPTGLIEFGSFSIGSSTTEANASTNLAFTVSDIQIVETSEVNLAIQATDSVVTLNPTIEVSPTNSPTQTPSVTTAEESPTPSVIVTLTPTPTPEPPTPTLAIGVSPTPSPTGSLVATSTPTPTVTSTPTPIPTATPTPTPLPTPTFTPTPKPTATPTTAPQASTGQSSGQPSSGSSSSPSSSSGSSSPQASSGGKRGDLNGDGKVNIFDLSVLLSGFNKTLARGDLNGDGRVTILDLSIILSGWNK